MSGTVPTDREVPEERDIETDLYAGRVRYVISRYYASRAQGCFDRATRNNASVRGTVVVGFTIGSGGQITRSSVGRNTTGNDTLGHCLANQGSHVALARAPWRTADVPRNAVLALSRTVRRQPGRPRPNRSAGAWPVSGPSTVAVGSLSAEVERWKS